VSKAVQQNTLPERSSTMEKSYAQASEILETQVCDWTPTYWKRREILPIDSKDD
jgi:hypothetical protein